MLYVVKFSNNLQGANLLFNECAGSELYRACGLAVPSWKALLVSDSFLERNRDCWMRSSEGYIRPTSGLCFGSHFLGGDGVHLQEILPKTDFKRVNNCTSFWLAWLIDICAEHVDNRQVVFRKTGSGWLDAFFIDHGHLFGGPKGVLRRHFQASRYLDPRIYGSVSSRQLLVFQKVLRCMDRDKLWRAIQTMPDHWKTRSALDGLDRCLCRLSTAKLLQNIVDTMVEAQRQSNECNGNERPCRRMSPDPILCLGIQVAGLGGHSVAKNLGRAPCD
jgi:hypothetical protein